jgi:hypothetical protein
MENYTKEDIVQALSNISDKSRKRVYVDQRSYLIGILAYRFMITEYAIAKLTGINRHKINYNKRLALDFCKDKSYVENVYVYAQMFPFDFTIIDRISPSKRLKRVELDIEKAFFNKLNAAGFILGHNDIRVTIKFLLEKSLKLWEE